jgi:hypothetical protein
MANDATTQPSAEVLAVLDWAISFTILAKDGKLFRIRGRTSELMHAMGYYCAEVKGMSPQQQLVVVADTLRYLSDRLA